MKLKDRRQNGQSNAPSGWPVQCPIWAIMGTIIICHYEWSWQTGLKTPSPRPCHPCPKTIRICYWIWSSAEGNNRILSLSTSPMPHHPSPETIIICYWEWSWAKGFKMTSPLPHHPSPETVIISHYEWSWRTGLPHLGPHPSLETIIIWH